ncbi:MAG: nuclear transport factor 2 family protein [Planctomycetota bacterium]
MQDRTKDREEILGHIHGIFQAYLRRDRDAIRRMHTPDWTGFQNPSTKIERGLNDYMKNADRSLEALQGIGYELLDTEVQFYDEVALVYYVARYDYKSLNDGSAGSLKLRSIDVYRRERDGWNQAGSHIAPITGENWGERGAAPPEVIASAGAVAAEGLFEPDRARLLNDREAVWRAWFSNNEAELRRLVPEDVIAIEPGSNRWADRDEICERSRRFVRDGGTLLRLEFPETRIQANSVAATIYTRYLVETEIAGARKISSGSATEMFQKRAGQWLNTGWHLDSGG